MADTWIVPIIQGYVQIETCYLMFDDEVSLYNGTEDDGGGGVGGVEYKICLVSRRSRHRAGKSFIPLSLNIQIIVIGNEMCV